MIHTLLIGLVDRIKKGFTVYNCEASVSLGILNTGPGLIFPTLKGLEWKVLQTHLDVTEVNSM